MALAIVACSIASCSGPSGQHEAAVATTSTVSLHNAGPRPIAFSADNRIWLVNADGTDLHPLTAGHGGAGDVAPSWAPDARRLAFTGGRDRIYVINADGSGERDIGLGFGPAWSPDGRRLLVQALGPNGLAMAALDADGKHRMDVQGGAAAWSRDGSAIAFTCAPRLCVMDANGKRTRVVADGVSADTVAWGPGPDIVYVDRADSNLYAVAPDGSRKRPMSSSPASMHRGPAWSPDGRQVLYWSDNTTRANVPGPSVAGVVTVTADGATTKVIAPRGGSAVWSPDGTAIAFLAEQNGLNVLMTTLADGSNPRVLVGPGSNVASQPPAWDSRLTGGAIE